MFLAYLIDIVSSQCQAGCLICDPTSSTCLFCDVLNNFYLSSGGCLKSSQTSCLKLSFSGPCLQCNSGFYLEASTGSCTQVTNTTSVPYCVLYAASGVCSQCANGYFVDGSQCTALKANITNCAIQFSNTVCISCNTGYILSLDGSNCASTSSSISNCAGYSMLQCSTCVSGYLINRNIYLYYLLGINTTPTYSNLLSAQMFSQRTKDNYVGTTDVCQKVVVTNCNQIATYNTCKFCSDGYYLNNGVCEIFPKTPIDSCAAYSSEKVCKACKQGFYLASSASCLNNTNITNCQTYATNTSTTVCLACISGYYLQTSTTCVARKDSLAISGCTSVDPLNDKCIACVFGFNVTSDGLKCLASISNCKTYDSSSATATSFVCVECLPTFYLQNGNCVSGTIPSCYIYAKNDGTTCNICLNGYFLNGGTCKAQPSITSCLAYSGDTDSTCNTCFANYLKFTNKAECVSVSQITGCSVYASTTSCATCALSYFLLNGACILMDPTLNCLSSTSLNSGCTLCATGYVLEGGLCKLPWAYILENCQNSTFPGTTAPFNSNCLVCNSGSIPFNFATYQLCYENSYLTSIIPSNNSPTVSFTDCKQLTNTTATSFKCRNCFFGKFLTSTGTCIPSCVINNGDGTQSPATARFHILTTSDNANYEFTTEAYCEQALVSGCQYFFPAAVVDATNTNNYCGQCASTYIAIITLTSTNTAAIGMNNFTLTNPNPLGPTSYFPPVSCSLPSATVKIFPGGATTMVSNCLYYYLLSTNNYGCIRCQQGYRGTMAELTSVGYLQACEDYRSITGCVSGAYIPGVPLRLNSVLSCHSCSDNSKIPFVYLGLGTTTTEAKMILRAYSPTQAFPKTLTTGTGYNVDCRSYNDATLLVTNMNINANCAAAVVNVEATSAAGDDASAANSDRSKLAAFCGACKPGYAPTDGFDNAGTPARITLMTSNCVAINSCQTSTWINGCTKCSTAYLYVSGKGVSYSACSSKNTDKNCYAFDDNALLCKYCNPGYTFNLDGVCEALIPPKCDTSNSMYPFSFDKLFLRVDLNSVGYYNPNGRGCAVCNTGYTSWDNGSTTRFICAKSSYAATNTFPSNTNYIPFCKTYYRDSASGKLQCSQCSSLYIVSSTFLNCFSNSQLSNCVQGLTATACAVCNSNYLVINGVCSPKSIVNCIAYTNDSTSTAAICSTCAPGYYLSNNACVVAFVRNCQLHGNTANSCLACMSGFQLTQIKGGFDYCFPISFTLNCASLNPTDFSQNIYTCTSCSGKNMYLLTTPTIKSKCIQYTMIDNCQVYDDAGTIGQVSLTCVQCNSGYYVLNGVCALRKSIITNCLNYTLTSDTCSICADGYYVSTSGAFCIVYPSGILNCRSYVSPTVCSECLTNFYLSSNKCLAVGTDKLIANCLYYSANGVCSKCSDGYALDGNSCRLASAQNCLTYRTYRDCATCPPNYGLQLSSTSTDCVAIKTDNCLIASVTSPFPCQLCFSGFYPDLNGTCKQTSAVSNCLYYDTASTCVACSIGYALTVDKKSCYNLGTFASKVDVNCNSTLLVNTPTCTACQGGYLFGASGCEPCKAVNCFYCHPENTTRCMMCNSNFYMTASGSCEQVIVVTPTDNSTNGNMSSFVLSFLTALLLAIIFTLN